MINVILFGANGKMGKVISHVVENDLDFHIVAGVSRQTDIHYYPVYHDPFSIQEKADLIIDFSHPSYLDSLLKYGVEKQLPVVIATTGYTDNQMTLIKETAKKIPILLSANMSLGINVLKRILKQYQSILDEFDIEIIEKHHNKKLDAPSGTAMMLAHTLNENNDYELVYGRSGSHKRQKKEIGLHALRGGTIVGEHSVIFAGNDEIIELKHTALSKEIFAYGAIKAGQFLMSQPVGFYTMDDIFN